MSPKGSDPVLSCRSHRPVHSTLPQLTLCSLGPVDGSVSTKVLHRSSHLGRVHSMAPQNCQQLLGIVGLLARYMGLLGLQKDSGGPSYNTFLILAG